MKKILLLFVISQLVGLLISNYYFEKDLPFGQEKLSPGGFNTVIQLFLGILVASGIALIVFKKKKHNYWKYFYGLALYMTLSISIYPIFKELSNLVSLIVVLLRFFSKDLFFHNATEILVYGGIAAVISPGLTPKTGLILLLVISVYDYISVYKSKHMITLAKGGLNTGIFPGLLTRPVEEVLKTANKTKAKLKGEKKNFSVLGGGDIAFPLVFTSIFLNQPLILIGCIIGSTLGLYSLFIMAKKQKFYPAMPPISAGLIAGWFISSSITYFLL